MGLENTRFEHGYSVPGAMPLAIAERRASGYIRDELDPGLARVMRRAVVVNKTEDKNHNDTTAQRRAIVPMRYTRREKNRA